MTIVFSILWVVGCEEFQTRKNYDDISSCSAYMHDMCMLGAPTSTGYVHVATLCNG